MTRPQGERSSPAFEAGHNHFNFGCSTGEEARQKLYPGMFAARKEETPETARPARGQAESRRDRGASDGVSVPPSPHLQYSGSVGRSIGNCAFTALSPETGTTSASTSASSDREELARKRAENHCLAEVICKEAKQRTSCVSRGDGNREQDTANLATFDGRGEFKRIVSCAVAPPPSSRAHDSTQGSSQFRWLKALLDVFVPHKPRANASMAEKEVARVCRIQCTEELQHLSQHCPACLPPGRVFHPADAGSPDKRTCSFSRTPQTPQPSAEVTQSLERVVTSQSCASTHDPGSCRGSCASLEGWSRSGNFLRSPYRLSPKVSSPRYLQPGSISDEHCSQRDAREAAEASAELLGSPREAVTAGILGEGTGGRRAPGTSKPAQNPGASGKLMKAERICTSVANKLASTPGGTGTVAVPGTETLTDTCHLETLSGAQRDVMVMREELFEPFVDNFITRGHRDGTADETATNGQRPAPVAPVASRYRGSQRNSATVNVRRNISKQLGEDTSCIFQNGVVGRSERRVVTDKTDCNTCRSCAEALPVCATKGEARLIHARASGLHERNNTSGLHERNSTPGEALVLRTFEEDTKVGSIDSDSTTRGSAHNEGDNTSVSPVSPIGDFRPRTPSSVCASPAFAGVRASSPSTEDLQKELPCPAPFRRGEQAYCLFDEECFLTASASAYIRKDRATCTQKAAPRNLGAADASAPPAVRGFKLPSCTGAATLFGCDGRSRTEEGRNAFQAQTVSPLTAALHTRDDADLLLHAYPFRSASERYTSLRRTVAERPTAGKQDTHLRRAKTADGEGTSFGLRAAVKGAEASRSIQEDRRQAATARFTAGRHEAPATANQEVHNFTCVTTAAPQRDARAKDVLPARMLHRTRSSDVRARVNQHVKRVPSILQSSRSCLESALMRAATITADLTCSSSGRESGKRGGEDAPSTAGRDRRWRSLGKSVCSRSSSGLSTKGLGGRESGDFVGLKLLSLVRKFQRDSHSDGSARQQEQPQQPDVRGGSVFVCAQDVAKATLSRPRDYSKQELAAGLDDRSSSSRRKGYRKLFKSSSFWSIRSDLRSREYRKLRFSSSFHALKKNGGEDEVIALNTDASLRQALRIKEGKLSRHLTAPSFSSHTNVIQRAATVAPLAAAEAPGLTSGVASVSVLEVQRRVGAVVPSAAAETAQGAPIAAAPSAAGIHPVSMAANSVAAVAAPAEKPAGREAKTANVRRSGAGVSGGVGVTGADTPRREGTGSFVLPSDYTILRTKETAMDSQRGQRSHPLQQQPQKEQPRDRPHVWNGDALGVRNSLETTSTTSCRSRAALEGCGVCSFSPSTSSSGAHHDLRGSGDSDDEFVYRVSSQSRAALSASAVALRPTVGVTPCEESPTSCPAIPSATSAAFAKSCVNARILAVHRHDGSVFRKHRNVSTGSSYRGPSLPTRAFSSEAPARSIEERDIASPLSWGKEKRVRNSRCRGASTPASLGVRSQAELFCSGHSQAFRPPLLGGSPHLECVSEGFSVQPQRDAKSAATCEHHSQQTKCSTVLRDRSLSSSAGIFVSPSWVKLPSILVFPRHPLSTCQGLSSMLTKEQQHQRQQNNSSCHTMRQQACKPPKPEAAACVDHCLLRCMQQEQNSQMPQLHLQQTQACQHQEGAARNCAFREVLSRHEGKRKSASMFSQIRKAAPAGAVRDQRARSLDVKFAEENKNVTSQRRRGLSNAPPCGSESETTRCATSCGEGDAEDSVELQFSAEASSGKPCAVSDVSASGGTDYRTPCRCSEVRRTWRRHCGHISCSRSGTEGQKSYGSECSRHSRWIPASRGRSRLRCKSFPVYMVHSAAIFRPGTTPLGLTLDDAALLCSFSSAGEIAQQTNGVDALHVQAVPLRKGACSLPTFGADRRSVSRCRPRTTFSVEDICLSGAGVSTASAGDNRCSGGGEASQQAMQQWMVDGTFRNADTESLLLKSTAERSSEVPRGAQEEAFLTHEGVALDSPASSRSSVVFTVEESTCETLEDEGNLPFLELLPLAHHRGSWRTQQHLQHDTRQHGSAALAAGGGDMGTFGNDGVAREWPEEGRDGNPRDTDVSTLLGCYQALASCWEENADEVNAYVPPSLHRFPQSSVSLLFSTAGLAAYQDDRFTTQLTPVRGAALPRTTAPAAAVDTKIASMPVVQERESAEAADAARDIAADAAAAGRKDSTGVATTDEGAGGGGVADPGGAPGSVLRHVTAGASAGRQGSSVSPARLHAPVHTRLCASGSSSGGNTASSSRCDSSSIENDCCIKSELRGSDVMSRRHTEPFFGGTRSVRGESFTSSSSTNTCSTTSGGTTGDIRESEKEEHERDGSIQCEPTHVRELYPTKVAIAGASFDDKLHAGPQCLLHLDAQLEVKAAEESQEDTLAAGEIECKPVFMSPLALPFSGASYVTVDAIGSDRQPPRDGETVVSLDFFSKVVARKGAVTYQERVSPYAAQTGSAAEVTSQENEVSEKQRYRRMEQQQDKEQQQTQKQRQQQKQQREWQHEVKQQSSQQGRENEQREKAQAHHQHGDRASSVLHVAHGGMHGIFSSGGSVVNNNAVKECVGRRLPRSQETACNCTTAAAAEKVDSAEATSLTGDEKKFAGSGGSWSAGLTKAQGEGEDIDVSEAGEGHRKHREQLPVGETTNLNTCDNIVQPKEQKQTDADLSGSGLEVPEKERIETSPSETVILQVKCSSLLLLLCGSNEALLADLPYFEGPLSLSVRKSTSSALRRRNSSHPRLLKSVQPAAPDVERLYYFVLSRGHLFWFTERSEFSSRGFDACVGSMSLLLNACHVRIDGEVLQLQKKYVSRGENSINRSNRSSSKYDTAATRSTATTAGRHWTNRFLLQFYQDASSCSGMDKRVSANSNARRGPGVRRSNTSISGGAGDTDASKDAECLILGGMELRVVSGAVFCPASGTLPVNYEEATYGNPASSAATAGERDTHTAHRTESESVCVTGRLRRTGLLAAACTSLDPVSFPTRERYSRDLPLCASSSAAPTSAPAAASAGVIAAAGIVPHVVVENGRSSGSVTTASAAAAAPSWLGRLGGARPGRRSAEKKAALASYAAAWVQHLQETIARGEELRRRFPQVNWPQQQLRAVMVASRCGVL